MSRESRISDGTKALVQIGRNGYGNFHNPVQPLYGRVVNIVLSQDDPLFTKYRVLEAIEFEPVQDRSIVNESGNVDKNYLVAYKLHSGIRTPIINEIVLLQNGPSLLVQDINSQFSEVFYYSHPISIYSSVEHNAAPDQNTQQNLNSFNSSQNKINSYQNANAGINKNIPGTDTIQANDSVRLGNYFTERGIKSLSPLEGDHKLEGRFGNSIRFAGTPGSKISGNLLWKGSSVGSPAILIRNNQLKIDPKVNTDSVFEDINKDGSSLYILSDQTIDLVLGSNNFDSYNQSNDNRAVKSQIIVTTRQIQSVTQSAASVDVITVPIDTQSLPVTQSSLNGSSIVATSELFNLPDNEDDLNFVQIGEDIPVPLTQGVILNAGNRNYRFVESVNASSKPDNNLVKAPTISISSVNAISIYAGQVSSVPTISKNGKALLDLLAIAEGTIGQGRFNGYDIMVTGKLIPGFDTVNASPPHPNIAIRSQFSNLSSASGRYQFIINTWNLVMGKGTLMNKFNQDYACWKNILNSANVPSLLINKIDTDFNSFKQVIDLMAHQWASFPGINNPKGYSNQGGRFSFETLYTYYSQILAKYK